ncbi:MAG: hypothetical protein ACR2HC_09970 [Thermoleophilaceae bacterium]
MATRKALAVGATAIAIGAGVAGCGGSSGSASKDKAPNPNSAEVSPPGDIPDNQAYVAYEPPAGGYSVKVPEGWARTAAGGSTTFTDKLNSVTMTAVPAKVPLTTAEARRTEVPKLKASVKGFQLGKVRTVMRSAGPAVRITYLAAGKPDPVTGKSRPQAVERYVFFHKGKDVVLTLSGAKGADNVDPWKIVTDSLTFTS